MRVFYFHDIFLHFSCSVVDNYTELDGHWNVTGRNFSGSGYLRSAIEGKLWCSKHENCFGVFVGPGPSFFAKTFPVRLISGNNFYKMYRKENTSGNFIYIFVKTNYID